jgi:FecR-like protein
MRKQWSLRSAALLVAIGVPSLALSAQTVRTALPGTVNYVEGQVSIDGKSLSAKQDGNTQLQPNQTLSTQNGKAEILLSPGTFVRAGNDTAVRMVSTGLVAPTIEVVRGEAMVEVDQKPKEAEVDVLEHGATASIVKEGLYSFHSDEGKIEVIDGKVKVTDTGGSKEFGRGKEVVLNGEPLKTVSFDRKAEDDLYRWSNVRSDYLAEANASTAQYIYGGYGPFWGDGWYWNPYFDSWSWLPGDGFFYSPFGYPFFSPGYAMYAPYYGRFGYRGGYGRAGLRGNGFVARNSAARPGVNMAPRISGGGFRGGGFSGGGFRGGGGFSGGGFRGGGGRR